MVVSWFSAGVSSFIATYIERENIAPTLTINPGHRFIDAVGLMRLYYYCCWQIFTKGSRQKTKGSTSKRTYSCL